MTNAPIDLSPDYINVSALKVVKRLTSAGYQAYLVGGCVRDLLLGNHPKDFDVIFWLNILFDVIIKLSVIDSNWWNNWISLEFTLTIHRSANIVEVKLSVVTVGVGEVFLETLKTFDSQLVAWEIGEIGQDMTKSAGV
jgi:hypothetical protein